MTPLTAQLPGARCLVDGLGDDAPYELVALSLPATVQIALPGDSLLSVVVTRGSIVATSPAGTGRTFSVLEGFHSTRPCTVRADGEDQATIVIGRSRRPGTTRNIGLCSLDQYTVHKPWGHEVWYTQNIEECPYALKQIHMKAGYQSSLQSHDIKTETNVIVDGRAKVHNGLQAPEDLDAAVDLDEIPAATHAPGSSWTSAPKILHRVIAIEDYTAIEVSTPELDDVIRWSDDANRGSCRIASEHSDPSPARTAELVDLYMAEQQAARGRLDRGVVHRLLERVLHTYKAGGTIYAAANGGNAGTLDHFACDFKYHPFVSDDKGALGLTGMPPLRFVNLTGSASELTGLTNDRGFDGVFAHSIDGLIGPDDLLMVFSGSGSSANVVAAVKVAKKAGAHVFSMSKGDGGKTAQMADTAMVVEGTSTFPGQTGGNDNNFHFEDLALSLNHILVGLLGARLTEESRHVRPE